MTAVPVARLSPSALSPWRQCRRSWRHRYVDHFKDEPGAPGVGGTFVHRTLELLYQEPPGSRTVDRARALAREAWTETTAGQEYQALGLSPRATWEMKDAAWKAIQRLWEMEQPETVEVRATERRLKVELGGVPFTGVIDRVDGSGQVIDYKSGKVPRYTDYTQLVLYAAAVRQIDGGALAPEAHFYYLKPAKTIGLEVTEGTVRQAVEGLSRSWQAIAVACEEEHFPAKPSVLCGWCPYQTFCHEGTTFLRIQAARKAAR
jgi:putative RecB family exonuclease